MRTNKYDLEQVERDYKYYKEKGDSDASIFYMLKERYRTRFEIAEAKFLASLTEETKNNSKEGEQQWRENYMQNITKEANK